MTGAIGAMQYYVAPPISVQLHNQAVYVNSIGGTATAPYTIAANKNVLGYLSAVLETWLIGVGASSSNYEVMATQTSGSAVTGTLATWLNCGTDRTWSLSNSAHDDSVLSAVLSVQIRDVATHTVQASASITLNAESQAR